MNFLAGVAKRSRLTPFLPWVYIAARGAVRHDPIDGSALQALQRATCLAPSPVVVPALVNGCFKRGRRPTRVAPGAFAVCGSVRALAASSGTAISLLPLTILQPVPVAGLPCAAPFWFQAGQTGADRTSANPPTARKCRAGKGAAPGRFGADHAPSANRPAREGARQDGSARAGPALLGAALLKSALKLCCQTGDPVGDRFTGKCMQQRGQALFKGIPFRVPRWPVRHADVPATVPAAGCVAGQDDTSALGAQ